MECGVGKTTPKTHARHAKLINIRPAAITHLPSHARVTLHGGWVYDAHAGWTIHNVTVHVVTALAGVPKPLADRLIANDQAARTSTEVAESPQKRKQRPGKSERARSCRGLLYGMKQGRATTLRLHVNHSNGYGCEASCSKTITKTMVSVSRAGIP